MPEINTAFDAINVVILCVTTGFFIGVGGVYLAVFLLECYVSKKYGPPIYDEELLEAMHKAGETNETA